MKKLILILTIFAFTGQELMAQWSIGGSSTIYRTGGADRAGDGGGVFDTQGDWTLDATISQYTSTQTLNDQGWDGNSHDGHGANGWGSAALGAYNRASGVGAFVAGFMNVAGPTGSRITSIPPSTTNLGGQFAVGYATAATGHAAFSAGQATTASGHYSSALGFETVASDYGSFVIGLYNSSGSSATSAASYSASAPAFVIGNGSNGSLSDAFKVLFSGNTTMAGDLTVTGNDVAFGNGETISNSTDETIAITAATTTVSGDLTVTGNDIKSSSATAITLSSDDVTIADDLTVTGDVNVSSDARLKSNIISLGSTLSKLLLIDGKSYTMIKDGDKKIGVLAQEVQKVFPELVSEDGNEMLSVNYQGLVPVLINAIKEQEDKISRLENLVEQLIENK